MHEAPYFISQLAKGHDVGVFIEKKGLVVRHPFPVSYFFNGVLNVGHFHTG